MSSNADSPEPISPESSLAAVPAAGPSASNAMDQAGTMRPKIMTVMCPVGFTAYATEGLTLDKPLFARVTYRPR